MDVVEVKLGEQTTLPDGSAVIQPDGTVMLFNGIKIQLDGQIILPDETLLKPGEEQSLPDGTVVKQS